MPSRTQGDRIIHRPLDRSDVPILVTWFIIVAVLAHGVMKLIVDGQ